MDRRSFLKASSAASFAALAGGLSACSSDDETTDGTAANLDDTVDVEVVADPIVYDGPARPVTLGFIALTDCAPLVMAKELGYFADRGLPDVTIAKQASWPATRDALLNGQIDGAHCLFGMPFSVATNIGGAGSRDLKIAMMLNNNGQAITLANEFADAGYGDLEAAKAALGAVDTPALGMTFPGGTHDIWLRYWLMACGIPFADVKIDPIPPPNMVQNMQVGNVKGYCVGEPWGAVAVQQDIGFTHIATQDIWLNHPEKSLVVNAGFAQETPVLKAVMAAVLQAQRWLDVPENRSAAAATIAPEAYVNAPAEDIRGRLTGVYDLGAGLGEKDFGGDQMQFFRDGMTPVPRRSHAIWYLAQYERMGLITETPPYEELCDEIILSDLYAEVAEAEGVTVPDDDMAPFEVVLDGVTFDPTKPEDEVSRT